MSAADLLARLEGAGASLEASGGRLRYFGSSDLFHPRTLEELRACKPELLALLAERQREAASDRYEERAAIAEVDGGLSREDAEALARGELLEGLGFTPDELGILQRDPWQAADLVRLAQLKAMTGGVVVPVPDPERGVEAGKQEWAPRLVQPGKWRNRAA